MNKTFNINLGSYPFAIDEDAYEYIQNYLNTIRRHFSSSDGCEEILYDIEVRMAELFQEHLKGRAIISMKEIDEVIMIMGKPEDFGAEPMHESFQSSSRGKKSETKIKTGKRLFRDPDDKKVGGVCSGISAYFGIEDPLWVRLIFAILFFTGGVGVITYILLWALVPEASNAGDKLAMRGEPATIENIAKVVEEELTEFGDKINEWSKDLGSKKKSDGVNQGFHAKSLISEGINIFGKVVSGIIPTMRMVFKPMFTIIAIIILSALGISWAGSFIGLSFASPVLFSMGPDSGLISYLGIGSLYFLIGLPLLGLMLTIARMTFGYKVHKNVKTVCWTLWFLSLFTTSFAAMSTIKEYRQLYDFTTNSDHNIESKEIHIVMPEENIDHSMGIHLGNFITEKDDKWAIRDVNISVEKSKDALVHISKRITSRGADASEAQENALFIANDLVVEGNQISISKYLTFPKNKRFRNQSLDYTIYIPEGKDIVFDNNTKERLKESSLMKWDQIYSDLENIKWTVKGNGIYSEEWESIHHHQKDINAGSYSRVIIEKEFDVVITKSDKANVSFSGNKDAVEKISYKNLEGTLTINAENMDDIEGITIHIQSPSLELIHFDGVRSAKIEGFSQDNLKLISKAEFTGNDTKIEFLGNIKNFDISLEGSQTIQLTGSGDQLDLNITEGAAVIADKYYVKKATWVGDNNFESTLNVSESFTCASPEQNAIKIIGKPEIIKL